ncbi:MAG: hypothetical protein OK456_01530 [Thaumarchaeota archaeon]|nr:hypothetical protein [Nitrososphaerota archaeon]
MGDEWASEVFMRDVRGEPVTAVTEVLVTPSGPIRKKYLSHYGVGAPQMPDDAQEEERLRKLYDQARAQGNRKKKKEYKEKLAELKRQRKYSQDDDDKEEDSEE